MAFSIWYSFSLPLQSQTSARNFLVPLTLSPQLPSTPQPPKFIFQSLYYTEATLAEAANFHVGKSKEHSSVLILFRFSATSTSHSFLGQSLFLVSLMSHILVFFSFLLQCLLVDLPLPLLIKRVNKIIPEKCL